jgi:hypothetical protein
MTESKRDMLIFPVKVRLGSVGEARLLRIERSERGPMAIYEVEPGDEGVFGEAVNALRDQFNLTYQPIPALWSSWRLLDDDLVLQVGLEQQAGRARAEAFRALRPKHNSLVSEAEVKALATGYLLRAGAEI